VEIQGCVLVSRRIVTRRRGLDACSTGRVMADVHSAHFEVSTDIERRVMRVRLSGVFSGEQMQAFAAACRQATEQFRGTKHTVIADMRGMKPLHQKVAQILGDVIRHGREHGCALCAHISDHTVQRLQAGRLARENSPTDDITVDVSSVSEAERVVDEARSRLDDARYGHSVRDSLVAIARATS
jgi:hypothetical protein